jgi:hypothetical protein
MPTKVLFQLDRELDVLQIGSSSIQKTFKLGISSERHFFVSIMNEKERQEYLYSQTKIRPNRYYHVVVTVRLGEVKDIALYVNAQFESMVRD